MKRWLIILVAMAGAARADVRLPRFISDNMVLQRDQPIRVWGFAAPGEQVTVSFGPRRATAVANDHGDWLATLEALPATTEPATLAVAGKNTLTRTNIVVGDVWVCSGQSNMAWWLRACDNGKEEVAQANYPNVRLLDFGAIETKTAPKTAPAPTNDLPAAWKVCTPAVAKDFSGVGYFFGRDLHKHLGVPIGLIGASVGGTCLQQWIPEEVFFNDTRYKKFAEAIVSGRQAQAESVKTLPARLAEWEAACQKIIATNPAAAKNPRALPPKPSAAPGPEAKFSGYYNVRIAPIRDFAIRGVIWYQGESGGMDYANSFQSLIQAWREKFRQPEMPFLFVQLPKFREPTEDPNQRGAWPEIREAQAAALALPKTGMAIAIDCGGNNNLHPPDKQPIAARLALAARAIAYGEKDLVYSGPLLDTMTIEGDKVRLRFKHAGSGLVIKGDKLTGFAVAGKNGKYVWANATIPADAKDTVILSSPQVPQPVMVRHCWADSPPIALFNKEGLPSAPFRAGEKAR